MEELFTLFGTIAIDVSQALADLANLTSAAEEAGAGVDEGVNEGAKGATAGVGGLWEKGVAFFGKIGLAAQGVSMVVGAIAGAVALPLKAFGDFEAKMKDISTLIDVDGAGAITRYGDALLQLSTDTGLGTTDLAGGLYQVISAVGETKGSIPILEAAAKAAVGGLSTTKEAINLSSAIMKGYGEVSASANQQALDFAQTTVKIGQTTFGELAASIGKITPLAAALGVTQKELFAAVGTLAGVTGNTAEVSTQMRATYQALMKPTADMTLALGEIATGLESQNKLVKNDLTENWKKASTEFDNSISKLNSLRTELKETNTTTDAGKDAAKNLKDAIKTQKDEVDALEKSYKAATSGLGSSIVKSQGFGKTLQDVTEFAGGNTATLGKMLGSVEAVTATLALGGPQATTYAKNVDAMATAAGASSEAFKKNANEGAQFSAAWQAILIKIGGVIDPIVDAFAVFGTTLLTGLLGFFKNLDTNAKALEPVMKGLKTLFDGAFSGLLTIYEQRIKPFLEAMKPAFENGLKAVGIAFDTIFKVIGKVLEGIGLLLKGDIVGAVGKFAEAIGTALSGGLKAMSQLAAGILESVSKLPAAMLQVGLNIISGIVTGVRNNLERLPIIASEIVGKLLKGVQSLAKEMLEIGKNLIDGIVNGIRANITKLAATVKDITDNVVGGLKNLLGIKSPSQVMAEEIGEPIVQGIGVGITSATPQLLASLKSLFSRIREAAEQFKNGDVLQGIGALFVGIANTIDSEAPGVNQALNSFAQGVQGALSALAKGDWIGAIIAGVAGIVNAVIDLFNGAAQSLENFKKLASSFSVVELSGKQVSRGWFADLFGGPATVAVLSEFGLKLAKTLESGVLSGLGNGIKAFFNGGNIIDGLRSGIRDAIINAITEAVIAGAILKGALGKLLEGLAQALSEGNFASAQGFIKQIGVAIPELSKNLESVLAPLRATLDAALPTNASAALSSPNAASSALVSSVGVSNAIAISSAPDFVPRLENAAGLINTAANIFSGAAGAFSTDVAKLRTDGIAIRLTVDGLARDFRG
jgi:TP901 family phage tail tape measure protein